ncbi:hypothetical protein CEXT_158281 [Caerostris extrusa]|uniref:Uncharacterized protein n=1 Tax=Caerostris extrusa TaxID=172846 RepID=A0AAV4PD16_CAEEX|nr:hypothetical protein CEXT_158281 [Caerostris extrusa]
MAVRLSSLSRLSPNPLSSRILAGLQIGANPFVGTTYPTPDASMRPSTRKRDVDPILQSKSLPTPQNLPSFTIIFLLLNGKKR